MSAKMIWGTGMWRNHNTWFKKSSCSLLSWQLYQCCRCKVILPWMIWFIPCLDVVIRVLSKTSHLHIPDPRSACILKLLGEDFPGYVFCDRPMAMLASVGYAWVMMMWHVGCTYLVIAHKFLLKWRHELMTYGLTRHFLTNMLTTVHMWVILHVALMWSNTHNLNRNNKTKLWRTPKERQQSLHK